MRKKIVLGMIIISSLTLIGCTQKEEPFESKVIKRFAAVEGELNKLKAEAEDMSGQIEILKGKLGVSSKPMFTPDDLKFSSIKVSAKNPESQNGEIRLPANSVFNLSIDVMNTTKENLSQLTCQAFLTYNLNGSFYNNHLLDTRFDVQPQNVRRKIEFKDFPMMDSKYEHILTVIIKDTSGNEVTKFEKKIFVK